MKWFQHKTDAHRNRKIRKVLRVHGPTGYGIWFALLEKLYEAEGEFQIKADELWLEDFADDLKITDPRTLTRVFDTFAEVGLISRQLWAEQVIYCEKIVEQGDEYIQKKAQNAERQARFREKAKGEKEGKSLVSNALRNGESNDVTPSEIRDQIQISESDPDLKSKILNKSLSLKDGDRRQVKIESPELEPERERTADAFPEPDFLDFVTASLRSTCKGNLIAYVNAALKSDRPAWEAEYRKHLEKRALADSARAEATNKLDFAVNPLVVVDKSSASREELGLRRDNFRRAWDSSPSRRKSLEEALRGQPELGLFVMDGQLCDFSEVAA